jgi:mRNA interferase MazF
VAGRAIHHAHRSQARRPVKRGEVWWANIFDKCPVVLLAGDGTAEFRVMRIVAPATVEERRGYVLLSGEEASELRAKRMAAPADADVRGMGVEVEIGAREGLPYDGVVRVALPRQGKIYCTWLVTLTRDDLVERAGALSPVRLRQLGDALHLAGLE